MVRPPVGAEALGGIGPAAKVAVPALTKMLGDPEWANRWTAADTLGKIGPEAKAAAPALTELLQDCDSRVSTAAFETLVQIGAEAKTAVPVLIKLLKKENRRNRVFAIRTLGKIGEGAKEAVPDLAKMLQVADCRYEAFDALCEMGPAARQALPALVKFVKNDYGVPGLGTPETTEKINPAGAAMVKVIAGWIHNDSSSVGSQAKQLWNVLGPEDIPSIRPLLRSERRSERILAASKLGICAGVHADDD